MGNYLGLQSATEDSKPAEPMESPTPEELAREKEIEACVVCKKSDNPLEEGPICYNTTLKGTVKPYYRHIIVCTGQTDWPAKISKEGFTSLLAKAVKENRPPSGEEYMLTACSEPNTGEGVDIILFPERIRYIGVREDTIPQFVAQFWASKDPNADRKPFTVKPLPWEHVVLICTHKQRDNRCGRIGPQVVAKLKEVLQSRGIPEERCKVLCTSHIGGHKYAGTGIVYPAGEWYGYLTARNAEKLVDRAIAGRIVYENWRGRMGMTKEEAKNA